jgi:aminopeptidase YwaD
MKKTRCVLVVTALLLASLSMSIQARNTQSGKATVSLGDPTIIEMINQIDESLLRKYHEGLLSFGPRYTGSISCILAAEYIYNAFQQMGLDVEFHEWRYGGFRCKNVVATLYGTNQNSTAEYIVCGHYDTVAGSPGANDDGSGTAAVLAIASILRDYPFNHTIRFITFSGEEVGTYGSFSYARDAYFRGDNIVAVLNMDMIGYASTTEGGRVLRFFPPERSRWIAEHACLIAEKYNDILDMRIDTLPAYRGADNQAFVDYGYDGVWIAHQDGYPWGHSPNDTADRLNWSYYEKATKLMLAITAESARKPIDVQVLLRRPYEGYTYMFNHALFESSFGKRWFAGLRGLTFIFGAKTVAKAEVFSEDPIKYVVFCIDGYFMFWDSQPPYEWTIKGWLYPIKGRHILNVYAYTESGKVAYDEMDIFMVSFTTSYKG